jgi:NADPH:quinone reductase
LPDGWGDWLPSRTLTRYCKCAAVSYLTFFASFVFGTPGFPLSDVPLQEIARKVEQGKFQAKPSRVFRFEDIREAQRVMEANEANGKMVVKL